MPIRADYDPRFYRRFYIMGALAIGFGLWCLTDAMFNYPRRRAVGFEEFRSINPTISIEDPVEFEANGDRQKRTEWQLYAHERGFKTGPDIGMQYILAAAASLIGLFLLSIPLRARGSWIELDETTLRTSWGQIVPIDQIEQIEKRKWRNKGIANIYYLDGTRKRRFVLDDMKFLRDPTDEILYHIEQQVGIERITGGPPEQLAEALYHDGAEHEAFPDESHEAS